MTRWVWPWVAVCLGAIVPWTGCDDEAEVGDPRGSGQGATSTSGPAAGGGAPTETATCQGHIYACGDLQDNDNDGLLDSQDADCLGPCDNTEDSLFGGIPGQPGPPCTLDCYFDQDSGAGNDDCYWNHACDTHEEAPEYYPEPWLGSACAHDENANTPGTDKSCAELFAEQSTTCLDYCGPLTPNGCDCFGCCELPSGSGNFVWLGSEGVAGNSVCTHEAVDNPEICHPCDPVDACLNGCGKCELCLGKTELPPECFDPDGGGQQDCPEGVQACGLPGQDPCPPGNYCITGCCQAVPE